MQKLNLSWLVLLACILAIQSTLVDSSPTPKHKKKPTLKPPPKHTQKAPEVSLFCKRFTSQCFKSGTAGKIGDEKTRLEHWCKRNGNKKSQSYTFGCKADHVDITNKVLKVIGEGQLITTSTATSVQTAIETSIVSTETDADTSVSTVQQTDSATVTSTATATEVQTEIAESTTVLTTVIPITATSTTITTVVVPTTVTTEVATSATTQVYMAGEPVEVYQVSLGPQDSQPHTKRSKKIDSSAFCSAFKTGCAKECQRVKSTPKHQICEAKTDNKYNLACKCQNGKLETQHALVAAAGAVHYTVASEVSTCTSVVSSTVTTTVPTTILSTFTTTETTTAPVTETYTTQSTISTTKTAFTGLDVTVTTTPTTITATTTSTSLTSVTASPTVVTVLNQVGYLHVFDTDGEDLGPVALSSESGLMTIQSYSKGSTPVEFAAAYDPSTDNYELMYTDGSDEVLTAESSEPDFEAGSSSSAFLENWTSSMCAEYRYGTGDDGPFEDWSCQSSIFKATYDDASATTGSANMLARWTNPSGSATDVYRPSVVYVSEYDGLLFVASPSAFKAQSGLSVEQVSLRFAYPSLD